jgi:hypothetical protein
VLFKDETTIDGQPAGPVTVIDVETYRADPEIRKNEDGLPYGYQPQGVTHLPWMPLAQAREVAAGHGIELEVL